MGCDGPESVAQPVRRPRPLSKRAAVRSNDSHGRNADSNAASPLCPLSTHSGGTASVGARYVRVSGATPRPARQAMPSPSMPDTPSPIRVNRAPVLTLWATVVAERLGLSPETALTLGRFVAGSSARAKARRLGISDEKQDAEERHPRAEELKPRDRRKFGGAMARALFSRPFSDQGWTRGLDFEASANRG